MGVLYLCDRKACVKCSKNECRHTTDISHAINFRYAGTDLYMERSENDPINCCDCEYLKVFNTDAIYAICTETKLEFEPFELDTRLYNCPKGKRRKTDNITPLGMDFDGNIDDCLSLMEERLKNESTNETSM